MPSSSESDESEPAVLSDHTMAILEKFLSDRERGEEEARKDPFQEDWGMSQVYMHLITSQSLSPNISSKFACLHLKSEEASFIAMSWLITIVLAVLLQFWYTDETAERLADEVIQMANGGRIACLACPSLLRKIREKYPSAESWLFEYDRRFEVSIKPFDVLGA